MTLEEDKTRNEPVALQDSDQFVPEHQDFLQSLIEKLGDESMRIPVAGTSQARQIFTVDQFRSLEQELTDFAQEHRGFLSAQFLTILARIRRIESVPTEKLLRIERAKIRRLKQDGFPGFRKSELYHTTTDSNGQEALFPMDDLIIEFAMGDHFRLAQVRGAHHKAGRHESAEIWSKNSEQVRTFCQKGFIEMSGRMVIDPAAIQHLKDRIASHFRFRASQDQRQSSVDAVHEITDKWVSYLNTVLRSFAQEREAMDRSSFSASQFLDSLQPNTQWYLQYNAEDQAYILGECAQHLNAASARMKESRLEEIYRILSYSSQAFPSRDELVVQSARALASRALSGREADMGGSLVQVAAHARAVVREQVLLLISDRFRQGDAAWNQLFLQSGKNDLGRAVNLSEDWDSLPMREAIHKTRRQLQEEMQS